MRIKILLVPFLFFLAGCANHNPYYNPAKPHHRPQGFTNNYAPAIEVPFVDIAKWARESRGLPKPPSRFIDGYKFPLQQTNVDFLHSNQTSTSYTWIGHSTGLLQIDGLNVLTDPIFSERASFVQFLGPKRKTPLPIRLEQLPPIHVVLISHNHYDHLDFNTVKALNRQPGGPPLYLVPLGMEKWLAEHGISNSRALDWWQTSRLQGLEITFVPSQHWSARGLFDRNQTLWGGWVVKSPRFSFYFAGDTGYSRDFIDIGERFGGFDLATIPVGVYEPRWFVKPQHVNPDEAVQIHRDVQAKLSIGVHWGTFEMSDEPLDQPIGDLEQARLRHGLPAQDFILLKHGETRVFD